MRKCGALPSEYRQLARRRSRKGTHRTGSGPSARSLPVVFSPAGSLVDATMPLILAIENNRQQITQLTSIVRGLGAELCVGGICRACAQGDREPRTGSDPEPPAAVAARRDGSDESITRAGHRRRARADALDSDTGHIGCEIARQTVHAAQRQRGLGGCAPEVFGGQLEEYLERATEERERTAALAQARRWPTVAESGIPASGRPLRGRGDTFAMSRRPKSEGLSRRPRESLSSAREAEERRAARAAAEALAAEERLAAGRSSGLAAAEARAIDEQRAADEAARIATDARIIEEQRAARPWPKRTPPRNAAPLRKRSGRGRSRRWTSSGDTANRPLACRRRTSCRGTARRSGRGRGEAARSARRCGRPRQAAAEARSRRRRAARGESRGRSKEGRGTSHCRPGRVGRGGGHGHQSGACRRAGRAGGRRRTNRRGAARGETVGRSKEGRRTPDRRRQAAWPRRGGQGRQSAACRRAGRAGCRRGAHHGGAECGEGRGRSEGRGRTT